MSRIAPVSSRAAALASTACSPSALFTTTMSASSSTPFLMPLQLVAGARQRQEHERVDHVGDGHLGLTHADGLDEDHVEPGRLEQHDRLAGGLGDAAQG